MRSTRRSNRSPSSWWDSFSGAGLAHVSIPPTPRAGIAGSTATSDDTGIVRLQLDRDAPLGSRTRFFANGNPFVLFHDTEIHLSVGKDRDDPSSDLHENRMSRLRGVNGHAADLRVIRLGPPRMGNTGINVNDYFHAVRLVRDDQFAAGRHPMLAKRGRQQIAALKPTALIRPIRIDRATAPLDAVWTPLAVRLAEFLHGHHLAAERAGAAVPSLFDGWRYFHPLSAENDRARFAYKLRFYPARR